MLFVNFCPTKAGQLQCRGVLENICSSPVLKIPKQIPIMTYIFSDVSRTPTKSKIELFVSLANDFQLLSNVLKNSILDVVGS